MPEHAHLLVFPRCSEASVAAILQSIKQPVARRAMNRHRAASPADALPDRFWQRGGGFDRNIVSRDALRNAIRYIHLNPVRRGLVDDPLDWPWSSARFHAGCDDALLRMDGMPR